MPRWRVLDRGEAAVLFKAAKQVGTKHIDDDIAFDYNEEGKIAGIEVLDASCRIAGIS